MGILLIGIWIGVFGGLIIFMLLKHDRR